MFSFPRGVKPRPSHVAHPNQKNPLARNIRWASTLSIRPGQRRSCPWPKLLLIIPIPFPSCLPARLCLKAETGRGDPVPEGPRSAPVPAPLMAVAGLQL